MLTGKGELLTPKGESAKKKASAAEKPGFNWCSPDFAEPGRAAVVEKVNATTAAGEGQPSQDGYFSCSLKQVQIGYLNVPGQQGLQLEVAQEQSFVHLHFSLRGSSRYRKAGAAKPFAAFSSQQHNLLYLPAHQLEVEWQPEEQLEVFEINISPRVFQNYLPDNHPLFTDFRQRLEKDQLALLSQHNLPVTPKMATILYEILHCSYRACYKCLFLEAKVLELLTLQLEQYEQHQTRPVLPELPEEEVAKMYQVREILLTNLEEPLSLGSLAHQVGTNEYSLKKHFKLVFCTTVFGYLHEHKMERAKELLLQGGVKIADIAHQMGYKHPTHFTSAFRKHFGYPPNKVK